MKKLSVLFLIAILGIVLWALPVGAEKIRLTDAELDGITAGVVPSLFEITVPPPDSIRCCVEAFFSVAGATFTGLPPDPTAVEDLNLVIKALGGVEIVISANGQATTPPPSANGKLQVNVSAHGVVANKIFQGSVP